MVALEHQGNESTLTSLPKYYIWGILIGFSLFYLAQSIFWQFGSYYLFAGIPGSTFFLIGLVGGLPVLIGLVGVYLWATLSDKWHRRIPFIIFGFLAQAISFFLYVFIQDSMTFLLVTCVAFFFSIAAVPMANAYLTEVQTFKGGAVGLLLATNSLGWAIGAFIGGFLFNIIGMAGLFLLGAIAYLVGIIFILLLTREVPKTLSDLGSDVKNPEVVIATSSGKRTPFHTILIIAVTVAIGAIGINAFSFFFGVYIIQEIAGSPEMVGIANGFAALVGLVITLGAGYGSDRHGRRPFILLGFGGWVIFMIVYIFVVNPWIATILWTIPLYPLVYTASYAAAADLSKIAERGRAMSTIATANSVGSGVGPIVGGSLLQFLTPTLRGNMLFAVIFNSIAFILVFFLVPETLRRRKK
jgi:MFS family permease